MSERENLYPSRANIKSPCCVLLSARAITSPIKKLDFATNGALFLPSFVLIFVVNVMRRNILGIYGSNNVIGRVADTLFVGL